MAGPPTTQATPQPASAPITGAERITSLDLIRGVAILGILPMNALAFGLDRLTNYLTQTVIGLATLGWLLDDVDLTRTMIAVWILAVWALQLWWSTWWLERFRSGPFEWAWRCGTYRTRQPLRRPRTTA